MYMYISIIIYLSPVKLVKLANNNSSLNFITTQGNYFVTGSADGAVKFYDFQFRLLAWFEDLSGGAVNSISFSLCDPSLEGHGGDASSAFHVQDFIVGTDKGLIIGVESYLFSLVMPDQRRGTLLVQGFDSAVKGISSHYFFLPLLLSLSPLSPTSPSLLHPISLFYKTYIHPSFSS